MRRFASPDNEYEEKRFDERGTDSDSDPMDPEMDGNAGAGAVAVAGVGGALAALSDSSRVSDALIIGLTFDSADIKSGEVATEPPAVPLP